MLYIRQLMAVLVRKRKESIRESTFKKEKKEKKDTTLATDKIIRLKPTTNISLYLKDGPLSGL